MTIKKIKQEMIDYIDFYGGNLLGVSEVESANSKEELSNIIEQHRDHMECMLADANNHLDNLKKGAGL